MRCDFQIFLMLPHCPSDWHGNPSSVASPYPSSLGSRSPLACTRCGSAQSGRARGPDSPCPLSPPRQRGGRSLPALTRSLQVGFLWWPLHVRIVCPRKGSLKTYKWKWQSLSLTSVNSYSHWYVIHGTAGVLLCVSDPRVVASAPISSAGLCLYHPALAVAPGIAACPPEKWLDLEHGIEIGLRDTSWAPNSFSVELEIWPKQLIILSLQNELSCSYCE